MPDLNQFEAISTLLSSGGVQALLAGAAVAIPIGFEFRKIAKERRDDALNDCFEASDLMARYSQIERDTLTDNRLLRLHACRQLADFVERWCADSKQFLTSQIYETIRECFVRFLVSYARWSPEEQRHVAPRGTGGIHYPAIQGFLKDHQELIQVARSRHADNDRLIPSRAA